MKIKYFRNRQKQRMDKREKGKAATPSLKLRRELIVHWYRQAFGNTWANDSTVFLTSVMTEYYSLPVYFGNFIHNKQCLRFSAIRPMEYRTSAIIECDTSKKPLVAEGA